MSSAVAALCTGAAFGAVLYKVGAVRASRVLGMLTLRDTKVMKFAFTAIGVASLLYGLAASLGVADSLHLAPPALRFLGWAHVLGGALFGAALASTGLCPGTCLAKLGAGVEERRFATLATTLGLFAGAVFYSAAKAPLTRAGIIAELDTPYALHRALGIAYAPAALIFGAAMVALSVLLDRYTIEVAAPGAADRKTAVDYLRGEWSWTAAGAIAGVLVVAATAQRGLLGFSGATLAFTELVLSAFGAVFSVIPRLDPGLIWPAALFAGVLPGAYLARVLSIGFDPRPFDVRPRTLDAAMLARSFAAGAVMCFGGLLGGGCTTGAFIAGWPTLSLGSFATAGTFFAVSMSIAFVRARVEHRREECSS